MTPTAITLALTIGFVMGLLGGGGSIIAVPAFTFLLHLPPKDAVVTSLAVVGLAAAAGTIGSWIRGVLPLTIALVVGLSATAGAFAGGVAGARIADDTQLMILAGVMLVAAIAMWRQPDPDPAAAPPRWPLLTAIGIGTGVLTGLVGVGGGFLIVPALVAGAGLPMRQAAAASLFVIMLAAFAGLAGYWGRTTIAWPFILRFAALASAGAIAGGVLAHRLPQRRLQQAFAVGLVVLGSYVFMRAR